MVRQFGVQCLGTQEMVSDCEDLENAELLNNTSPPTKKKVA